MKEYKLILETSVGGLEWEYPFTIASDDMAMGYARRHTLRFQHVPWFNGMVLVRADHSEILGRFKLTVPEVEEVR